MQVPFSTSNLAQVLPARELAERAGASESPAANWSLESLAGRFVEISGDAATAAVTTAAALILQAQTRGGLAVWVGGTDSTFYPPDFAASGIDLDALAVVRIDDTAKLWHAADTLLRSGAFAVVVLDQGAKVRVPLAVQTRLVGLAKKHHAALLLLTRKTNRNATGGSLVSVRGETEKKRAAHDCFLCEVHIVKDKRHAPGTVHTEVRCGPEGMS